MAALSSTAASRAEGQQEQVRQDQVLQEKPGLQLSLLPPLGPPVLDDHQPEQEAQQKVSLELFAADAQVVKGKQYSADTSTETVQTLTDGNRIVHHTVSKFYRDSEGRTRREETFGNVDTNNPTPHEVKVFIEDPVAGTAYVLDPGLKTLEKVQHSVRFFGNANDNSDATKVMFKSIKDDDDAAQLAPGHMMIKIRDEHSGDPNTIVISDMDEKRETVTEELGSKNIEGVDCTGTRKTTTIPASQMGNEKPIAIVNETWFAPSIGAVVQSITDDPRYGKTTYQLTNLQTSDPARSLFEPPADYKVEVRK